jgi:hypothetical protein
VNGTIGQHVGGPLINDQFSVTGGHRVLPTPVQVVGAPTLKIPSHNSGERGSLVDTGYPGVVLQETWPLSSAIGTNSLTGITNPVVVPANVPASSIACSSRSRFGTGVCQGIAGRRSCSRLQAG